MTFANAWPVLAAPKGWNRSHRCSSVYQLADSHEEQRIQSYENLTPSLLFFMPMKWFSSNPLLRTSVLSSAVKIPPNFLHFKELWYLLLPSSDGAEPLSRPLTRYSSLHAVGHQPPEISHCKWLWRLGDILQRFVAKVGRSENIFQLREKVIFFKLGCFVALCADDKKKERECERHKVWSLLQNSMKSLFETKQGIFWNTHCTLEQQPWSQSSFFKKIFLISVVGCYTSKAKFPVFQILPDLVF